MWEDGDLLNKEGSEGGQVLKDEIYTKGCRVTLEKCSTYYAITCGVFGAFCHTTFCGEQKSLVLYEQIKNIFRKDLKSRNICGTIFDIILSLLVGRFLRGDSK